LPAADWLFFDRSSAFAPAKIKKFQKMLVKLQISVRIARVE
jgi:hypothetical protein